MAELERPDIPDTDVLAAVPAPNHGEVFTQPWVVELILELAGYTPDRDLADLLAVEPACGSGAFLAPMAKRLSESCRRYGRDILDAADAVYAVDLQEDHVEAAKVAVAKVLLHDGWSLDAAEAVAEAWMHAEDFLLDSELSGRADVVLGNPPYVRLEEVDPEKRLQYRRSCTTMGGRADLFVGFIEKGLQALRADGVLGFICADRWMRNQYGRGVRGLIAEAFSVEATVIMHDVDAFEDRVSAYPAISIIRRAEQGPSLMADTTAEFGPASSELLKKWHRARDGPLSVPGCSAAVLPKWFQGNAAWPTGTPTDLSVLADLEARFPALEDPSTGTRVGIGVATGADKVFITKDSGAAEFDRLLPLSIVRDTRSGHLEWSGHYLVNPWTESGLVPLADYPQLADYYESHSTALKKRHIAGKRPSDWYRTIDRVHPPLAGRPKLLFPDMKMRISPVYENEGLYPHHNLYFVTSDAWPIKALGGLLLSRVAELFVRAYAVKMRGGTLRFQAQYLRRIRVPRLGDLSEEDLAALTSAFEERDVDKATAVATRLYGLKRDYLGS